MREGREFIIYTDQKPLTYAFKQKPDKCTPRQLRHLDYISQFSTDIRNVVGTENKVADALSRVEIDAIIKPPILDYKKFAQAQLQDSEIQSFLKADSSIKPEKQYFPLEDVSLYCDKSLETPRPFVPKNLRQVVFQNLHFLSHLGISATTNLISKRFFWPGMRKDIKNRVRACEKCQRAKVFKHTKAPLSTFALPDARFAHIHIDYIGPCPPSKGYKYCLTIIDRYTRWPEVIPTEDMLAETTARALLNGWISRFGTPVTITTDQGTNFESSLMRELTNMMGSHRIHSASYHPQSNGMIERFHRHLKSAIIAHENAGWTDILPIVLLGLRSAMKNDLKATSSQLVYGTTLRLPSDLISSESLQTSVTPTYVSKNRLKENVKSIFQEIHAKNSLLKWSKHIHCNESMDSSTDVSYHSLDSICVDSQDSFALLTAWRDFLLIIAVYEPLMLSSDIKEKILKDILEHLLKEMQENNSRSLILLSELFLMLSKHWKSELISLLNSEDSYNPIFHILNEVAYNAENIHPREQLVVVSIAVFIVRLHSKTNLEIKNIKDWIVPCCQLLKKASFLIHQPLDPKNIEGVLKLPIVIVCLLNELIQEVQDWLSILKNHSVVPLLVSLLIKSLKLNAGLQLAHNIITLLLSMGSHKKAAEALCNTGFMPEVTLILSDIDMNMHISEKRKNLTSQKNKLSRVDVYFTFLRFVTVLLQTLGNYFLQDCWNFIGVHQEAMHITLVELKNSFLREGIQDAILTCTFILQLSSHQHLWRLEHPRSLEMLLVDVCNCIYGTVAILCKPELLKYLVMHKKMPDSKPLKSLETESLLKRSSSEDGQTPAEVEEIQQKLFELLAVSLTILTKYCPEMYETMSGHTIDYAQWQLLLHVSFSIPSLDRDGPLCFGTILACVNMCLKLLVKNDKTPSPRKTVETSTPVSRQILMYILEISLAILLSQSTVALTHPDLPVRDKQLVRRELAAELNSMNITMNRYLRRGPLSPAGLSIPATSPGLLTKSQSTEFPFMKLISNLVDKLFK
ncbi:hypothetical protein TNCV_418891 [Trichonephila clavipes]|nr:hypothetical protein TNCV_418891 [Trichonephila clavipes]